MYRFCVCRFFLLAAIVLLSALKPELPAHAEGVVHKAVAGPFLVSRDNGTPLVEVAFRNGKTGLFAIDTGADDCVMTPGCAKRLGYKQDDNPVYLRGLIYDGITLKFPTVQVHDMRIGRLQISDITFAVAPGNTINSENGRPIDGLLGGTLLSRFALLLDYPHRTLAWVYPGDLDDNTVSELGLDPKSVIGLQQEEPAGQSFKINHYGTRVHLQSGEKKWDETLYIDTGASGSSISAESARRLGLVPTGTTPFSYVFEAPDIADQSFVPLFNIGQFSFADVPVIYPTHSGSYMVSLIGENVLGGCRVLFDFGPHRCYLQPVLPGLVPGLLPPVDVSRIDWERLRNAPEPLGFGEMMQAVEFPEWLESLPAEEARLKASSDGTEDADRCARMGTMMRDKGDDAGAKLAFERAASLRRAEAEAHPDDSQRAARYTDTLVSDSQLTDAQTEAALAEAQKSAARWPVSPAVWCALGAAQELRAASLLLAGSVKAVADDPALRVTPSSEKAISWDAEKKLIKPDPARVRQITALRVSTQESFDKAVALAPQDPDCYRRRARYWLVDRTLLSILDTLGVKGQSPSSETALAGELADYRMEAVLRPDDPTALRRVLWISTALPEFREDRWYQKQLRGTGQAAELKPGSLMTEAAALAHLTALSESADTQVAAPALEALGRVQASQEDPLAEATLRRALARDPTRRGALSALATLLIADNRPGVLADVLLKCFDGSASLQSDSPASSLLLSEALSAAGQPATAEEAARAALKSLPDSPDANLALARLLLARSGDDPQALPEAAACLVKADAGFGTFASPGQKAALQTLQAVRQALGGDPAGARTQLLRLLHDQPTCTQAREALYALTVDAEK